MNLSFLSFHSEISRTNSFLGYFTDNVRREQDGKSYDRSKLYFEVTFSLTSPSQILSSLMFAVAKLVQSLNSPFFPPHIGAEPGRVQPLYGAGRKESSGTGLLPS